MDRWDIALWAAGIILVTALTVFGTIEAVNWYMPSNPYSAGHQGTGVVPKAK